MRASLLGFSLLFVLSLGQVQAQVASVSDVQILIDSRQDVMPSSDTNRTQGRVRLGFTIDVNGIVEVVGLASTGPSFNNDWATVVNANGSTDQVTLAFRQLYLRKIMGRYSVEAGALSPEPTIGAAGLGASGWMDGIRVRANTTIGNIKVVAGSLGDFKQPNAFALDFKGNFIEIEMGYKVFEKLLAHTAYENFNDESYIKQNLQLDLKLVGDRVFKLFADALYDVERNAFNYELGVEFDLLENIVNKYDKRLEMKVYLSDVNEAIPNRSQTLSAFYVYGPRFTVQLGGKLDRKGTTNWFTRASLGKENRFDVGISIKINKKK